MSKYLPPDYGAPEEALQILACIEAMPLPAALVVLTDLARPVKGSNGLAAPVQRAISHALFACQWAQPANLAWRHNHLQWMRSVSAQSEPGEAPRFQIGREMDGRHFSAREIADEERLLAFLDGIAASEQVPA